MKLKKFYLNIPLDDLEFISNNLSSWDFLKNKSILVSGGTGFIGKWILASFLYTNDKYSLNAKIYILSREPQFFLNKFPKLHDLENIKFIKGDVKDFTFEKDVNIDFAIHAAADVVANRTNYGIFNDCLYGTSNFINQIKKANCKKMLLLSSGAVYGNNYGAENNISENYFGAPDTMNPASAYGEGKRASELLSCIATESSNLSITIARCFAFVGPYLPLDKHFAIGNFILSAMRNETILIKGDGTPLRSYLYSADLVLWLWELLFSRENLKVYNIGGSEALSIESLAKKVVSVLNSSSPINVALPKNKNKLIQNYIPNISRIYNDFGLAPHYDLKSSIERTANFNKDFIS